jgi:serine/threonine protein kinase
LNRVDISNNNKIKIIKQILAAFTFIHYNEIIHRDIKSLNILIDTNFNIKVCDFGLARYKSELSYTQFSGTPAYMAPELFIKKGYDEKVDIFAFGTLMWEILVRKIPYDGFDVSEIRNKVLSEEQLFVPKIVSNDLAEIIHSCRVNDPNKRPSFMELAVMLDKF